MAASIVAAALHVGVTTMMVANAARIPTADTGISLASYADA